ncbi:MAG: hypothetical protein WDM89_22650 [Rhizomicrobium sp.]
MRGTVLLMPSINARGSARDASSGTPNGEWLTFCQEVREAADQLRTIASRAEAAAVNSEIDGNDLMRAMAREVGVLGSPATARAKTFATMMLGPSPPSKSCGAE